MSSGDVLLIDCGKEVVGPEVDPLGALRQGASPQLRVWLEKAETLPGTEGLDTGRARFQDGGDKPIQRALFGFETMSNVVGRLTPTLDTVIEYSDAEGHSTRRRITIMEVRKFGENHVLEAFCHTRKEMRTFRVDRISAAITDDGEIIRTKDLVKLVNERIKENTRDIPRKTNARYTILAGSAAAALLAYLVSSYGEMNFLGPFALFMLPVLIAGATHYLIARGVRAVRRRIRGKQPNPGLAHEFEFPEIPAQPFAGRTFIFTGRFMRISRAEAQAMVQSLGGRVKAHVPVPHYPGTLVVIGAQPGSKAAVAQKHNVPTIDEDAFLKMLEHHEALLTDP